MDLFGTRKIEALEKALDFAQHQIEILREENRRLLCTINPHLKQAFFPNEDKPSVFGPDVTVRMERGFPTLYERCSLQMSDKKIRFCATHQQDLDEQGRCPVTEVVLFHTAVPNKKRILGSEFCRSRDEQFTEEKN